MKLTANWRAVLRHAWSIRFMLGALLLDAAAAAIHFIDLPIHPAIPAALASLATTGAIFARVVAQRQLSGAPPTTIPWETGDDHEDQH